jgi:hypothetical protein
MMMKKILILIIATMILCSCTSCEPSDIQVIDMLSCIDSTPPSLVEIEGVSSYAFKLAFSELLGDREDFTVMLDDKITTNFKIDGSSLIIYSNVKLTPGKKYNLKVEAVDQSGNSLIVESQCFSKNQNPAKLLISEISTKGTKKYGDRVELICTNSGCLAGITVANGFNYNWEDRCVLPDISISAGDLIVIGFNEETESDYKSENLDGLSSNNGCLIVSETPDVNSPIQDCIVYSNKTSTTFEGFANGHIEETVNNLIRIGEWEMATPLCSAAVNTTYETSTRSINRKADLWGNYQDTNTQDDFYITVTSGQTFGSKNNTKVYEIPDN